MTDLPDDGGAAPVVTLELAPRRLTLVCRVVAVFVLVAFGVLAVLLTQGNDDGQVFGRGDQIGFFGIGLLLALGVLSFTRARVRADSRGIWVRNLMGERYFPWQVVAAVDLPKGAPWAQLELQDDDTVSLLAVQANDGDSAVEAVLALRSLLRRSGETGPL